MKVHEVIQCSLPKWYHRFKKVTFRSRCLLLTVPVLEYLKSDGGLILPAECSVENREEKEEDYEGDTEVDWDDKDNDEMPMPSFPEFCQQLRDAMAELGGTVFCKLNWSSPRDAAWMAQLDCTTLSQIFLLLKSSDFTAHDLMQPFKDCEDVETAEEVEDFIANKGYYLVLRKWVPINPGHEFRCFIKGRSIIGICQRDITNYYRHIHEDKEDIKRDIRSFFDEFIVENFSLDSFTMDVVRRSKDDVRLVDFNPFGVTTDGLLFDWDDLAKINPGPSTDIDFRYITNNAGIQPHSYRQYSVPRDIVDLASGTDADKLVDFLKLQERQQSDED